MPNVIVPTGSQVLTTYVTEYINPTPPASGIIYVSKGERWDSIAYKMYGDPTQIESLIQNNPGILIQDYVDAGVQVFVPIITPPVTSTISTPWG